MSSSLIALFAHCLECFAEILGGQRLAGLIFGDQGANLLDGAPGFYSKSGVR